MNTSIQTLSFQNFPVSFRADGYLNATEIAEHFGKRINNYLRNERTQEYISALIEFLNTPETQNRATAENQLVIVKKGGNDKSAQGTWLHPKLAIDFARWLNPKFAVWCDMQIEKILHSNSASPKPTKDERTGLRQAVTMLVGKADINHSAAYKLVHHRFGVASIEDLTHEQIPQAIEYVHRLILDGEVLDKPKKHTVALPEFELVRIAQYLSKTYLSMQLFHELHRALCALSPHFTKRTREEVENNLPLLRGIVHHLQDYSGSLKDPFFNEQFAKSMQFLGRITPQCLAFR